MEYGIDKQTQVPYIVHEAAMARQERTVKKLWIVVILLIVLLVATNAGWVWYESQWEVVETTVESQTDGGGTAIANADGSVIINGEGKSYDKNPST